MDPTKAIATDRGPFDRSPVFTLSHSNRGGRAGSKAAPGNIPAAPRTFGPSLPKPPPFADQLVAGLFAGRPFRCWLVRRVVKRQDVITAEKMLPGYTKPKLASASGRARSHDGSRSPRLSPAIAADTGTASLPRQKPKPPPASFQLQIFSARRSLKLRSPASRRSRYPSRGWFDVVAAPSSFEMSPGSDHARQ